MLMIPVIYNIHVRVLAEDVVGRTENKEASAKSIFKYHEEVLLIKLLY